jgi:hypothetical protein
MWPSGAFIAEVRFERFDQRVVRGLSDEKSSDR